MTSTVPSAGVLQADDPNYRQFTAASQFEPSPISRQFAAMLVATCPRDLRHDPSACAEHLQGVTAAHGLTDLADRGRRLAEPHLADADEALDELMAANRELEEAAHRRSSLPDEPVDALPARAGRAAIRRQLAQNQHIAGQRELVGDFEHRRSGSPGWIGWVVASIVAVIETVVTLRIFNVDLTDLTWSAVPWFALTVGLVFFNHQVAAYLGQKRRAAREIEEAAVRLHTGGFHGFHHDSSGVDGSGGHAMPGRMSGLAPSADQVRRARRAQWLALAIYGIPLVLLMAGLYLRMFASTERLIDLGAFSYVFPLIVVAVLASLLWALVVEPYSRGNALGDHLRSQLAADVDTVDRDEELLEDGRAAAIEARRHADAARAALMSADQEVADMAELGHRGLQIAHSALGVATMGPIRTENLVLRTSPHRERIERAVAVEEARTLRGVDQLEQCTLAPIDSGDSPHTIYATPPTVVPDLGFVIPETLAPYAGSTLSLDGHDDMEEHATRSRAPMLAGALALVLLAAAATWYFFLQRTDEVAAATPTTTESSVDAGDLTEGVDYDFITRVAGGAPARWDCDSTITVRLGGPAPDGADTAMIEAVDALRSASHLPLVVGAPLPATVNDVDVADGEIVVNYLPSLEFEANDTDVSTDTLGMGGGRPDATGRITAGWIAIRGDSPEADPMTPSGREVLWHEGAHTLNVSHSVQNTTSPEIMAPVMEPGEPLAWGPGDRFALAAVGCDRSST